MNKIVRGLKAIGNGFMPVSKIKSTLLFFIWWYGFILLSNLCSNFTTHRQIMVGNIATGDSVLVNNVYQKPQISKSMLLKLDVDKPVAFVLVNSGAQNESIFNGVLKLLACILLSVLIWKIDLLDPFNPVYSSEVTRTGNLIMLIIVTEVVSYFYSSYWFNNYRKTIEYGPFNDLNPLYCICFLWLVRVIMVFYKAGVKSQQEAELTI